MIKIRKVKDIEDGIKRINKLYLQCGYKTTLIHADSDFEPLRPEMADLGISFNCVSKKEYVPDIERFNHTIKDPIRYYQSAIPFRWISK